ncbi:glycosyltransferase family 1 protein [Massilia sp. W12]|uniref:glycosyltransferase family 4 protein n=1 Tax=Massilia sp. W12 TaxID=3126507 RepID=UPI0030D54913
MALPQHKMRIALVTDTWAPAVNGVVMTLQATCKGLQQRGHEVEVIGPQGMKSICWPGFSDVPLALHASARVEQSLQTFAPDLIHIATEGPLGLAARRYCLQNRLQFSTAYHTRFPEYLWQRARVPLALTYRWLRWFHGPAQAVLVSSERMRQVLQARGFANLCLWGRGVDTALFSPDEVGRRACCHIVQDSGCGKGHDPVFMYVGRVAAEKNLPAFLSLDLPGRKWVVGDGPARAQLEQRFPQVRFVGMRAHHELPAWLNCADVFVFPSQTDTLGLVMLEAMACGVPVAAFPVAGPLDVVQQGVSGMLDMDLRQAALSALDLPRAQVRAHALQFGWEATVTQFLQHCPPRQSQSARAPAIPVALQSRI